jgi:DNA-binding FadR family transcriptional regulator
MPVDRAAYEGDIVSRLKNWRGLHLAHSGNLFEEAAVEIERLREAIRRLADQDATLSVQGGGVTVTLDATLTDEERKAIKWAYSLLEPRKSVGSCAETAATLRNLLERTK